MKIAVAAEGAYRDSPVDSHFARTRYFLVVDLASDAADVRNNTDLQKIPFLAGTQAAGTLISLGIDAVITANIGPKAFVTFKSAGIKVLQAKSGTVGENLDLFEAGQLVEFAGPNVEERWPKEPRHL